MNHLQKEQLVDLLLRERVEPEWQAHLRECEHCRQRMDTLELGLDAVRAEEAKVPIMALPRISYSQMKRKSMTSRLAWFAAAAMLVLSLLGFRFEVGQDGVAFQLALFASPAEVADARIERLEQQLMLTMDAIESQAILTQDQMDARFNALLLERDDDVGAFTRVVDQKMEAFELEQERGRILAGEQIMNELRKNKGALQ